MKKIIFFNKIKIGTKAVSRYIHSAKYFLIDSGSKTFDHEFNIYNDLFISSACYFNKKVINNNNF